MPYALITGSSKGIGKAIAESLAERKYNLILVDRDRKTLIDTATAIISKYAVQVEYLHIDIAAPKATETIFLATKPLHDELNIVINNAGFGINSSFEDAQLEEQLNLIDVNVKALVKLSHVFIPVLKNKNKAWLLNTASTTAYHAVPYVNVYASSKAFVLSFTRGLRHELRNTNISVSALCPGSTDTSFAVKAGMSAGTLKVASRFNMDPKEVGETAVAQMLKGKAEIVPGFTNKLHAALIKFFPKKLIERIAGDLYEKKEKATVYTPAATIGGNILTVAE